MVFFTCNHCGESAKKPAVEKHYNTRCRGMTKNVSCMDCQKDFHGEEYVAHTKCITEAEKYSGKDYVHRESKNSGAKKQESWMDILRSILETSEYNLSKQARSAFQRLQSVDNVPRKKQKFHNFVSNCMRLPKGVAEEVWNVLEKELEKMKEIKQAEITAAKAAQEAAKTENDAQTTVTENGNSEPLKNGTKRHSEENGNDNSGKKSKIDKLSDNNIDSTTATEEQPAVDEFQWIAVLEKIVGKHDDGIILEKLKKKTLKKYKSKLVLENMNEKQQKKFDKKFSKNLKKCTGIQVNGEIVKAC